MKFNCLHRIDSSFLFVQIDRLMRHSETVKLHFENHNVNYQNEPAKNTQGEKRIFCTTLSIDVIISMNDDEMRLKK